MKLSPEQISKFFVQMGLPAPVTELRFDEPVPGCKPRLWRFDYAFPDRRVALEIEGGVWSGGRHTSSAGFVKDMEKYNRAAVLGWRILRIQPKELLTLKTVMMVKAALTLA